MKELYGLVRMNRRCKILSIPTRYILSWFMLQNKNLPEYAIKLVIPDLPEDIEIIDVNYSWESNTFKFKISHELFEEVEEGIMWPEWGVVKDKHPMWEAVKIGPHIIEDK